MALITSNLVNISTDTSIRFGSLTLAPYGTEGCAKVCVDTAENLNIAWALYKSSGRPVGVPDAGEMTALQSAPYTHATFDGVSDTSGMGAQLSAVASEDDDYTVRTVRVVNTSDSTIQLGGQSLKPYGTDGCAKWVSGTATELNNTWAVHKTEGGRVLAEPTEGEFNTMQVSPFTHASYDGVVVMADFLIHD